MLSNITFNSQNDSGDQQSLLVQGDPVYLYGDKNYTGTLIRPIERTYPPKWTVKLDRGGYEAVNLSDLSFTSPNQKTYSSRKTNLPYPTYVLKKS